MALTERKEIGSREIKADGQIQVREDTIIEKDGVELSRTFHRHVVVPGDDFDNEDPLVKRIALIEHTPDAVQKFLALQAAQQARVPEKP